MTGQQQTRFLDRESYRAKRLIDASRLLLIVGMLGFITPPLYLFFEAEDPASPEISAVYLFIMWLVLILGAFFLAPRMRDTPKSD